MVDNVDALGDNAVGTHLPEGLCWAAEQGDTGCRGFQWFCVEATGRRKLQHLPYALEP